MIFIWTIFATIHSKLTFKVIFKKKTAAILTLSLDVPCLQDNQCTNVHKLKSIFILYNCSSAHSIAILLTILLSSSIDFHLHCCQDLLFFPFVTLLCAIASSEEIQSKEFAHQNLLATSFIAKQNHICIYSKFKVPQIRLWNSCHIRICDLQFLEDWITKFGVLYVYYWP